VITKQTINCPSKWKYDGVWLTTKQVADRYGISPRRVRKIADDRGISGRDLGGVLVWTEEQVDLLQPRKRGAAGHMKNVIIKRMQDEIDQMKGSK
tara:strand:+ start:828 stop:1112 length:285 start_codon:yes stop_codon:yes gene_type:complete